MGVEGGEEEEEDGPILVPYTYNARYLLLRITVLGENLFVSYFT